MPLLDYQVPSRASRSDTDLGEVDLLGATDQGCLVVIELKAPRKDGSRGDTPLLAQREGLRHAAVVHANQRTIGAEANRRFAVWVPDAPPIVQTLSFESLCPATCSKLS